MDGRVYMELWQPDVTDVAPSVVFYSKFVWKSQKNVAYVKIYEYCSAYLLMSLKSVLDSTLLGVAMSRPTVLQLDKQ